MGVDARAKTRVPGLSDIEYFAQSMYEPTAFVVPGFPPAMPPVNLPPIGLNDQENAFKGDVNIQAHKEVQFKIIKRVMYSCATAGYGNINFAVMQIAGPDGVAPGATAATGAP